MRAGDLAVQAPPHACQELLGEVLEIQHGPGFALQGVEMKAGLASCSPDPGPCVKELLNLPIAGVVVVNPSQEGYYNRNNPLVEGVPPHIHRPSLVS